MGPTPRHMPHGQGSGQYIELVKADVSTTSQGRHLAGDALTVNDGDDLVTSSECDDHGSNQCTLGRLITVESPAYGHWNNGHDDDRRRRRAELYGNKATTNNNTK